MPSSTARSILSITIAALVAIAAAPALADPPAPRVMFTGGALTVVAQERDTQVDIVDLLSESTLDTLSLGGVGAVGSVEDLPDIVTLNANGPIQAIAGRMGTSGGWSSFVPGVSGQWQSDRFITWASGDLIITLSLQGDSAENAAVFMNPVDDTGELPTPQLVASNRRVAVYQVSGLDRARVEIVLSHPGTVQLVSELDARAAWTVAPASSSPGEDTVGVVSGAVLAIQSSLIVVPLYPDTDITLLDLSDGDDSGSWTLSPGDILTTLPIPGAIVQGQNATVTGSPFDRDLVELRASRPVAVVAGAFETSPRRGIASASAPVGPGRHIALIAAEPGRMHLLSDTPAAIRVEALASAGNTLSRITTLSPQQWRGQGPHRAVIEVGEEQLFFIESDAPFIAMSEVNGDDNCCGPFVVPPLATSTTPVAEAGPAIRTCPRQSFTLSGADSFDPNQEDNDIGITAFEWDLDLDRNTDGEGSSDDDIDAQSADVEHLYATSGIYRARLTVTDNEDLRDSDDVEIQVLSPADPVCGTDPDSDGLGSLFDNCPEDANPDQIDLDMDGLGDICDLDIDGDNVDNIEDSCPRRPNPGQSDNDRDGVGDACDDDNDNDGVENELDNCPWIFNRDQRDLDSDHQGDACDRDIDGDGHPNPSDNCPDVSNLLQTDTDEDLQGDLCDEDDDNDGIPDPRDNCQFQPNPSQEDRNTNGVGDACEEDRDSDGITDPRDNCPDTPNADQSDIDDDRAGDACDRDIDGDNIDNIPDNCPTVFNPEQEDEDDNNIGDACEPDLDGDDIPDHRDNCPETPNPTQNDLDGDGEGDACDRDIDGDGLTQDQERTFETRSDNPDTDADGLLDGQEIEIGTNPRLWDTDSDDLSDGIEIDAGTNPSNADTDNDGIRDSAEPGWNEDSDLDGLVNAADADSDNGGVNDGDELDRGLDMLDPTDDIPSDPQIQGGDCAQCSATAPRNPSNTALLALLLGLGWIVVRRRAALP